MKVTHFACRCPHTAEAPGEEQALAEGQSEVRRTVEYSFCYEGVRLDETYGVSISFRLEGRSTVAPIAPNLLESNTESKTIFINYFLNDVRE